MEGGQSSGMGPLAGLSYQQEAGQSANSLIKWLGKASAHSPGAQSLNSSWKAGNTGKLPAEGSEHMLSFIKAPSGIFSLG